jgi:hypothetical protein
VRPLNEYDIWHSSDAQTARWAMASAAAPDERVLVLVPVCGGTRAGLLDLSPGIEAPAFEGQRAQHFPPRLDEVEVGRVFRLEHELPARVRQSEQQHVQTGVNIEVVEHGVDPLGCGPIQVSTWPRKSTQFAVVRRSSVTVKAAPVAGCKAPNT